MVREPKDSDAAILLLIYSIALGAEWTVRWSGGGRRGTASHPTSPPPIAQAEKNEVIFFSEPTPSTLNGHLILVTTSQTQIWLILNKMTKLKKWT